MPEWVSIPGLINLILFGMMLEAGWLFWRHRQLGKSGIPPMLLHLMSGALLLLAMKLALSGAPLMTVAGTLGIAGLAHLADLRISLTRD